MKIVHVTTVDTGGAYKAALRLHEGLQKNGLESQLIVRTKFYPDSPVIECNDNRWKRGISKFKNGINLLYKKGEMHGDKWGTDISHNKFVLEADVIVLHWINSFLSLNDIAKLCRSGKRVIWILHDMWMFTGGCHYDRYCARYEKECGCCPLLKSHKANDISHKNFLYKAKKISDLSISAVGPSQWIVECAKKSKILQGKNIVYIPNMIDVNKYSPILDKESLRIKYHIQQNKKIILFGAADQGTENPMKGFSYLVNAIRTLSPEEYALAIFGNAGRNIEELNEFDIYLLGYIDNESELREIYNLADVFVNPSLQEAFGYTVCEAMACGTPVVAFEVGGNKEQISHKRNGYLAQYGITGDLATGISYCASHRDELGIQAYRSAQEYSYENIGRKYMEYFNI